MFFERYLKQRRHSIEGVLENPILLFCYFSLTPLHRWAILNSAKHRKDRYHFDKSFYTLRWSFVAKFYALILFLLLYAFLEVFLFDGLEKSDRVAFTIGSYMMVMITMNALRLKWYNLSSETLYKNRFSIAAIVGVYLLTMIAIILLFVKFYFFITIGLVVLMFFLSVRNSKNKATFLVNRSLELAVSLFWIELVAAFVLLLIVAVLGAVF